MLPNRPEEAADEPVRRPFREADPSTGPADAEKRGRRAFLIRREHHPEGGNDDIETCIGKRKSFRVCIAREGTSSDRG